MAEQSRTCMYPGCRRLTRSESGTCWQHVGKMGFSGIHAPKGSLSLIPMEMVEVDPNLTEELYTDAAEFIERFVGDLEEAGENPFDQQWHLQEAVEEEYGKGTIDPDWVETTATETSTLLKKNAELLSSMGINLPSSGKASSLHEVANNAYEMRRQQQDALDGVAWAKDMTDQVLAQQLSFSTQAAERGSPGADRELVFLQAESARRANERELNQNPPGLTMQEADQLNAERQRRRDEGYPDI